MRGTGTLSTAGTIEDVVRVVKNHVNKAFHPGETNQCALFVREVFRLADVEVGNANPPTDADLVRSVGEGFGPAFADSFSGNDVGRRVGRQELLPGDIVLFRNTIGRPNGEPYPTGTITHVGIYVGNDRMVHRPTVSRPVEDVDMDERFGNLFVEGRRVPDGRPASTPATTTAPLSASEVVIDAHDGRVGMRMDGQAVAVTRATFNHTIGESGGTALEATVTFKSGGEDRTYKIFHHDNRVSASLEGGTLAVADFSLKSHIVPGKDMGMSITVLHASVAAAATPAAPAPTSANPAVAQFIREFFSQKNPRAQLAEVGNFMVGAGQRNDVDPLVLLAIAAHETIYGTAGVGIDGMLGVGAFDRDPNNAIRNPRFRGPENQIRVGAVTFKNLREDGNSSSRDTIETQLAAVNRAGWASDVNWHKGVMRHFKEIVRAAEAAGVR